MSLTVTAIETPEALAALEPAWAALSGEQPFLGPAWARLWWKHYHTASMQLLVLAVRDAAGELVGVMPWYLDRSVAKGRIVRFIGSNETCGDRLTLVTTDAYREAAIDAVAGWLADDTKCTWNFLELTGVEGGDVAINRLLTQLRAAGHPTHQRSDLNAWRLSLPTDWEQLLARMSKSRRSHTRRALKQNYDVGRAVQKCIQTREEFERGFEILIDLHQKRRNSIGEPGCFASDKFHDFHREFALEMLAVRKMRLAWTEIDSRPVAVEYNFIGNSGGNSTIYHYQCGFDPAAAEENPGRLNLVATLKWAVENGYRHFDMLRGDEEYKAHFRAEPTQLGQFRAAGSSPMSRARFAAWLAQASAKQWIKQRQAVAQATANAKPADESEPVTAR